MTLKIKWGSCWLDGNVKHFKATLKGFFGAIFEATTAVTQRTKKTSFFRTTLHVPLALQLTLLLKYHQEMIYYTCHYTYFYILSTVVGKVSSFGRAALCHWRGLRLQLDSQPLEGDGASSWRCLSPCSASSDRKLGNVCARGIKVIVRPDPVERRSKETVRWVLRL